MSMVVIRPVEADKGGSWQAGILRESASGDLPDRTCWSRSEFRQHAASLVAAGRVVAPQGIAADTPFGTVPCYRRRCLAECQRSSDSGHSRGSKGQPPPRTLAIRRAALCASRGGPRARTLSVRSPTHRLYARCTAHSPLPRCPSISRRQISPTIRRRDRSLRSHASG